jgi:hypothetical protein
VVKWKWLRLGLVVATAMVLAVPANAATIDAWTFGEPDGSPTVTSSNGHVGTLENDGTSSGVALSAGELHFDGHGRVVVPHDDSLNPYDQPFTVSVEARTSAVPSDEIGDFDLMRKGVAADKRYWKVELFPNLANMKAFAFCQMRGRNAALGKLVGTRLKWTGANLADGDWHTIVCEKTSSQVTLSVDGVVRVTKDVSVGTVNNTKPLAMGAKAEVFQDMFAGDMDDVSYAIG